MNKITSLVVIAFAMAIAACGNGEPSPPFPAETATAPTAQEPPAASGPRVLGNPGAVAPAMAMLEAVGAHGNLVASPLVFTVGSAEWTVMMESGPCAQGGGTVQITLDGTAPDQLAELSLGDHTYAATFINCLVDGLTGTTLTGTASARYSRGSSDRLAATVTSGGIRGTGTLTQFANLEDLNAAGTARWTLETTSTGSTMTYVPSAGATLVNNRSGRMLTFASGTYAVASNFDPFFVQSTYERLTFDINGHRYTLDGAIKRTYAKGLVSGGSGEVQIIETESRAVVGKILANGTALQVELYDPIMQF